VKIHRIFLKNLLQNHWAKFNQTWYKLRNQVYSNKGPGPLQRGDNHKNVRIGWGHLKTFFSRTTSPILTRLGTNYPWREGFKFVQTKGIAPLQGEVIAKE
jgi:hypothetical protein